MNSTQIHHDIGKQYIKEMQTGKLYMENMQQKKVLESSYCLGCQNSVESIEGSTMTY